MTTISPCHRPSKYYAIIGKSDWLAIANRIYGFWEILEAHVQPYGWLISIAYQQPKIPKHLPKIWDCGAYSYRFQDFPQIDGNLVTASWAIEEYERRDAKPKDIIIAPDSILLPGSRLEIRREFNATNAEAFLELAQKRLPWCLAMAVAQGMTEIEKITSAKYLYKLGYRAIAVGGMATQANNKQGNIQTINAIRSSLPDDCYLHILGLCSVNYSKAFNELGIDSYDGTTYLIEALRGSVFFLSQGAKLIKHKIGRSLAKITAPICYCHPCSWLRNVGFETREYGCQPNNKGRIVHNLGQLVSSQKSINNQRTIALIACVSKKQSLAAPASELYISNWFKSVKKYVKLLELEFYLISALHGVLTANEIMQPYEQSPYQLTTKHRKTWASKVVKTLTSIAPVGTEFVLFGGKCYREFIVEPLTEQGYSIRLPLKGLGIGEQQSWLKWQMSNLMKPMVF